MCKKSLWVSEVPDEPSITSDRTRGVSGWELRMLGIRSFKRLLRSSARPMLCPFSYT
ncbi:hypothetical protein BDR05DRAFT_971460 [Suillus weaverae]|nr:hypothetical protein BDR05DRAFT_971460 [Suillus weaverae]